jgi:molybdopterin-guanine dinucleotide biosynthesis protein
MIDVKDMARTIVAINGFSSEVGKTTLLCELLGALPGWEAIKMTRGHYRSCGKDPHACCVSHLLGDEPLIRSGRRETYIPGKDTGRYWDAGASAVHWVIATDSQVEQGIQLALERVRAPGVLIEGNSFLQFVEVDFAVMVARAGGGQIKPSARRALKVCSALYLFDESGDANAARERFTMRTQSADDRAILAALPIYTRAELPSLITRIQEIQALKPFDSDGNGGSRETRNADA